MTCSRTSAWFPTLRVLFLALECHPTTLRIQFCFHLRNLLCSFLAFFCRGTGTTSTGMRTVAPSLARSVATKNRSRLLERGGVESVVIRNTYLCLVLVPYLEPGTAAAAAYA